MFIEAGVAESWCVSSHPGCAQDLISQKFLEVLRNKPAEDPNLNVFDETSGHKTVAPTDEMRARIKQRYNNRCAFCGAEKTQEVPVTCAHLTKRTGKYDQGFPAGFDLQSDRNFIYLCGTKGRLGTCHDGFDTHLLALLPGVLDQPWRVISCYEHFKKQDPHAKLPQFHDPSFRFQPNMLYNRVLSTRLRKFCQQNQRQCQNMENSEEFAKCVDVVSQLSRSASHRGDPFREVDSDSACEVGSSSSALPSAPSGPKAVPPRVTAVQPHEPVVVQPREGYPRAMGS